MSDRNLGEMIDPFDEDLLDGVPRCVPDGTSLADHDSVSELGSFSVDFSLVDSSLGDFHPERSSDADDDDAGRSSVSDLSMQEEEEDDDADRPPHDNNVLSIVGTRWYLELLKERKVEYNESASRLERHRIAQEIVIYIRSQGFRFVEIRPGTGLRYEVGVGEAVASTMRALEEWPAAPRCAVVEWPLQLAARGALDPVRRRTKSRGSCDRRVRSIHSTHHRLFLPLCVF
jgi:hypothetical protein